MKKCITWVLLLVAEGVVLLVAASNEAQAHPSFGANCAGCHGGNNPLPDLMQVKDGTGMLNIDAINLPGATDRGLLKVFDVIPGNTVKLPMEVLDGADVYAVELKGLTTAAVLNDAANKLVWSAANDAGNVWTQRGTSTPYFTKDDGTDNGIVWTAQTTPYEFDLFVDASTPMDVYDLTFAVALSAGGDPTRYGEEHFYVRAVPEPAAWTMLASSGIICLAWFWRRRNR
jgi:hypothetical protein